MNRPCGRALVVALAVTLIVGCSDDDDGGQSTATTVPSDPDRAAAIDVVTSSLVAYPRAAFQSDDEPRCVAEHIVDALSRERLEAVGLDIAQRTPPDLFEPQLTKAEGDQVAAAYDQCVRPAAREVDRFTEEGMSREEAQCASDGYRASGIPRVHLLEPPHGPGAPGREAAHASLDGLYSALKTACRAWY